MSLFNDITTFDFLTEAESAVRPIALELPSSQIKRNGVIRAVKERMSDIDVHVGSDENPKGATHYMFFFTPYTTEQLAKSLSKVLKTEEGIVKQALITPEQSHFPIEAMNKIPSWKYPSFGKDYEDYLVKVKKYISRAKSRWNKKDQLIDELQAARSGTEGQVLKAMESINRAMGVRKSSKDSGSLHDFIKEGEEKIGGELEARAEEQMRENYPAEAEKFNARKAELEYWVNRMRGARTAYYKEGGIEFKRFIDSRLALMSQAGDNALDIAEDTLSDIDKAFKNTVQKNVFDTELKKFQEAAQQAGVGRQELEKEKESRGRKQVVDSLNDYAYTEQKTEGEVMANHLVLTDEILGSPDLSEEQKKQTKELLDDYTQWKLGIMKGIEEKQKGTFGKEEPEEEKQQMPGEASSTGTIIEDAPEGSVSKYAHVFILPLGKKIIVDAPKYKVDESLKEDDELTTSMLNKIGKVLDAWAGYDMEPEIAAVNQYYQGARDAIGTMAQWGTRSSIGLLLGTLGAAMSPGKAKEKFAKGQDLGEYFGKFIKHEMIARPGEANPVIADMENEVRHTMGLKEIKTDEERKSRYNKYNKNYQHLKENFEGGATGQPGVAPTGVPSVPQYTEKGTRDYTPATREKEGSAFAVDSRKKKRKKSSKKKKKNESLMGGIFGIEIKNSEQ